MTDEERMRRFVNKFMETVPHLQALGIGYVASGSNWAELQMPYAPQLVAYPDTGVIASGAIFSLMDSAAGFSVVVARGRMEPHATLDLRCDYLRPARPGETVIGRAECYKLTKRVAFVRGIAHDGDPEHPIAHVAGTFMFTAAEAQS
ncbi:PaaI family thioesterase [Sandaracinobacteroides hominis]|uniref:PaaI family thioesterase n=1 Tax=Sandaracinobacteroides hominis TaxID=2780086 RepID=UPI002E2CB2BD|nr:PaaI family thioesterase [Sandaracinobacteroides hominis]